MSTKVKGNAIKEGSIPLSALDDSIVKNINSKYGLSEYAGVLTTKNTKFVGTRYLYYVLAKGKIYDTSKGDVILDSGPRIVIHVTRDHEKTTLEVTDNISAIGAYGTIEIFGTYNAPPQETPNWNAQEGEAGYIENKPFYATIFEGTIYNNTINFSSLDAIYDVEDGKLVLEIPTDYVRKQFTPDIGETWKHYWRGIYEIIVTYDGGIDLYITCDAAPEKLPEILNSVICYTASKRIDDVYLPNTIVKTTPQELSSTDKNQALANLGIPIVLNINTYGIEDNLTIDELSEILGDCVTNEILIQGLCHKTEYDTVYLPTLHQSYVYIDGRKILNKLVCGQYRIDEESYDIDLFVAPSIYLYYDEETQHYRSILEEY